jgi:alpha-mannosidase
MTVTVHVVMHAHLDPIWMWPWTSGLDEALATARSACDRLDAHPDLFYTQGEAWSFHLIERADPALFKRVSAHVASGRWEVVNGWWTQPDCNIPSALGLRRQIEVGMRYVKSRFGVTPRCGFNPDSFGHAAIVPEVLRDCGQDRYVFMRPMHHERWLPKRLFRWRAKHGGRQVTAFRIGHGYINKESLDAIRFDLQNLPDGCAHAMTMAGLGDHGGGPTEQIIAWVRRSVDAIPGAKLVFSTVGRFFDAVEKQGVELPEVEGELQMHAVGCYSVVRAVKTGVRRAEERLAQAETVASADDAARLDEAWRQVASHHFHDTLGGTCLPSAYVHVVDQLGAAAATAEEVLQFGLRRRMAGLPDDPRPRVVLFNTGAQPFSGWCDIEPYLEGRWTAPWRLVDERGAEVPFQEIEPEAAIASGWWWNKRRCLVHLDIPAGGVRQLHLDISATPTPPAPRVTIAADGIASDSGAGVRIGPGGAHLTKGGTASGSVSLSLIADPSDTWSHGIDRYGEGGEAPVWSEAQRLDAGPLMASLALTGTIGRSRLRAEWRVFAGDPAVELILDVEWAERYQVLKLVLPLTGGARRIDGTPGMALERDNDGIERPLAGWTALPGMGVACPDVFAMDCKPMRARLTLLRAAVMACHDPNPGSPARATWSDHGVHRFRFRFVPGGADPTVLAAQTEALLRPPVVAELTRGMGPWH